MGVEVGGLEMGGALMLGHDFNVLKLLWEKKRW